MKKVISLLVITIILSIPVFAQDSTKVDPNVKYVTEKIEHGISVLSAKLKQPAEHVYTVLVKQQAIKARTNAAFSMFCLILTIVSLSLYSKHYKIYRLTNKDRTSHDYDNALESTFVTYVVIGCITGFAWLISTIAFIFDSLPRLLNPEYYAIGEILNIL